MAEILKEWLTERLQLPIKWDADDFGTLMKNGHVVANILLSYHVINDEQFYLIRNSNTILDIKRNWKYLSTWLHELNVNLSEVDLNNIMEGRGSSLLRLFYSLFLYLDRKDRIDFIKHERKMVSNLIDKVSAMKRFTVNKVDDEVEPEIDDLSRPLLNERHVIEWQKKKATEVKELHDFVTHRYLKMMKRIDDKKVCKPKQIPRKTACTVKRPPSETAKIEMREFAKRYPCNFVNHSYEKLMELNQEQEDKQPLVDSEWVKNFMDNLHTKMDKKEETEEFHKHMSAVVSTSLWDFSLAEEENVIDEEFSKKILKLSLYEKQMCTQIMEVKQQARNVSDNRRIAEAEFADQRDRQFSQHLDNLKEQLHLEAVEIDYEKHRQVVLHKFLYAEKMKRKRRHYYEICYEIMLSIVDFSVKHGYYKKLFEDEIPEHFIHEWKNLYYKMQPIFDIADPMEDILQDHMPEEELVPEEEEIIRLELDRQDALNECEFHEYIHYYGPWALDILIPNNDEMIDTEERKLEYLGGRILGHVVFTLLEIKYPYPPAKPPADIPLYPSRALVRCLPDRTITLAMQTLMKKRNILITRVESAINHCLKLFQLEMVGCLDIELSYDKFIHSTSDEANKDLIRSMKTDEDIASKSSDVYATSMHTQLPPNTKQTQTPKTIPEEEIKLSDAAELGRYAYEALSFGEPMTDHLIAAMLVEYIKAQTDIDGFVIINYPNSYREAQILEETFSGREPPDEKEMLEDRDDIYLEETIARHRKKEKDIFKEVRVSKLVIDPHKKVVDEPFVSYFTTYIHLRETLDILQEEFIWDLNEENSEMIDRFYAVLGINYSMYYEMIEKEFLGLMCRYIIGDLQLPWNSYEDLFGSDVMTLLDFNSTEDKRQKFKVVKPELSTTKTKDKRNSKTQTKPSDLEMGRSTESRKFAVDADMSTRSAIKSEQASEATEVVEEKPLPGDELWEYGSLPIVEAIGKAVASCWEQIEKTYVNDIEQLLLSKRLQMNCVIPYTRFLKDKMEQIITLPSYKQDLVAAFQKEYNDFEDDWRDINIAKNEWHCRIRDLQQRLYHICDERKLHAEQQRQALICENWAMEELTTMANTYISMMQAEINRSTLSHQIMHDFYVMQLKRYPTHDRLQSKELTKINRESEESGGAKKPTEDKVFRQIRNAFMDLQLKNINLDFANNPFNMVVNTNYQNALKIIKDMNDQFRSVIAKEFSDASKIPIPVKKKDEEEKPMDEISPEELQKINSLKCIEEWIMGVNGEMHRANLRLQALQSKCFLDMKLFNDIIYKAFMDIQARINTYYMNELAAVDRLCKYVQMAIEEGRVIPESLILEHDQFIIDPNLLLIPIEQAAFDSEELKEVVAPMDFKISQLARLRSQFQICGPTGLALQQTFIYLLQDFIFYGKETIEGPLVPEGWRSIDPEQVPQLVVRLFGETVYVDWRDFLIICLNLRYPNVDELLEMRTHFRCKDPETTELISRDDYLEMEFWYEDMFDPEDRYAILRKVLIKHFLFELFETAPDVMNYSAFLLAFCKSDSPVEGFTNAISMAVGKKTCYQLEYCLDVVCKLIDDKRYRDACRACALDCADKFLAALMNNVERICEGTVIEEVPFVSTDVDDKKGKKKGKGKGKDKDDKGGKGNADKSKNILVTEVKQTYICPPCADDSPEEIPSIVVEEQEVVRPPVPDERLEYTVSQDVIWNILKICMPWHFVHVPEVKATPYVDDVTEVLERLEADTDSGDIYICKFVTDPKICRLLHKVRRFSNVNLAVEAQRILIAPPTKPLASSRSALVPH